MPACHYLPLDPEGYRRDLTLRATEGFLRSWFHLLGWELPVPDYTTLCKRAKRLAVSLLRKAAGPLHVTVQS